VIGACARFCRLIGRLSISTRALGAVEFALVAPFLILIYIGGYQLMDAISAYRKVTVTARSLADLATQNEQINPDNATSILGAARQVMTPYSTLGSTLMIAEIAIDDDGAASITWICSNQNEPTCAASDPKINVNDIDVPKDLLVPDTSIIFSNVLFHYTPVVGGSLIGPLNFSDHIFMNPRRSPSVCLNTGTATVPVCMGEGTN